MTTQPQPIPELLEAARITEAAQKQERRRRSRQGAAHWRGQQIARELAREQAAVADEANADARGSLGAIVWLLLAAVAISVIAAWAAWLWAVGA